MTYTTVEGTTRTDEETSTDGATNGNHVQMARLHRLVEDNKCAALGTALEGLEVETIAGHEVLLFTPFIIVAFGEDGGLGSTGLLVGVQSLFVLVLHGGRWEGMKDGLESNNQQHPGNGVL